jgi:hypothetical protein
MGEMCKKCSGVSKLVVGALLLMNAFVWPRWLGIDGWVSFVAVLFVIGGFVKLVVPNKCVACNAGIAKGKKK